MTRLRDLLICLTCTAILAVVAIWTVAESRSRARDLRLIEIRQEQDDAFEQSAIEYEEALRAPRTYEPILRGD